MELIERCLDVWVGLNVIDVFGLAAGNHLLRGAFCLADGPSLSHGLFCNFALELRGWKAKEAAGVPVRKASLGDELLEVVGKLEKADEIEDGGTVLAGAGADLLGIQIQFLTEAIEGHSGLDRVQVFALYILDEGDFEEMVVGDLTDDDWDASEAREFGRPPAALTSD